MALSENIRFYRERAGMYQSDLGRILGVSAQAVSKWEVGKAEPDQLAILKMCELFDCSVNQLFGMNDNKNEPRDSTGLDQVLSNDELRLLVSYRALSLEGREKVLAYVSDISVLYASEKNQTFPHSSSLK